MAKPSGSHFPNSYGTGRSSSLIPAPSPLLTKGIYLRYPAEGVPGLQVCASAAPFAAGALPGFQLKLYRVHWDPEKQHRVM